LGGRVSGRARRHIRTPLIKERPRLFISHFLVLLAFRRGLDNHLSFSGRGDVRSCVDDLLPHHPA